MFDPSRIRDRNAVQDGLTRLEYIIKLLTRSEEARVQGVDRQGLRVEPRHFIELLFRTISYPEEKMGVRDASEPHIMPAVMTNEIV